MKIDYVIAGKPDQYASLKLWKYSECSENVKESQVLSNRLSIILSVLCVGGGTEWFP